MMIVMMILMIKMIIARSRAGRCTPAYVDDDVDNDASDYDDSMILNMMLMMISCSRSRAGRCTPRPWAVSSITWTTSATSSPSTSASMTTITASATRTTPSASGGTERCAGISHRLTRYWFLIGREWSHDLDTGLWLVESNHMTWILASDWSRNLNDVEFKIFYIIVLYPC